MAEREAAPPNANGDREVAPPPPPPAAPAQPGEEGAGAHAGAGPAAVPEELEKVLYKPEPPYDDERKQQIQKFFLGRIGKPDLFTFDKAGNLEILDEEGQAQGNIRLKRYIPLDPGMRAELEQSRAESLAALDKEYEEARKELQARTTEYDTTGEIQPVLAANERVSDLDARRCAMRSALRWTQNLDVPVVSKILFELNKETRKLFTGKEELIQLRLRNFRLEEDYGRYVEDEDAPAAEAAAAAGGLGADELAIHQPLKDGRLARIFFEASDSEVNGFLSPMYPVEFTFEETRYFTALQAYEAERAKELGMGDLRTKLLATRSALTIRILTKKVEGHPKDAAGLWLRILTACYQQNGVLAEKLVTTGSDTLVYADMRPGPSGTGVAKESRDILDASKWKSENLVGKALETLRTQLREGNAEEAPEAGAPKEGVISEEEQQAAKVGAIINNARRRGAGGANGGF